MNFKFDLQRFADTNYLKDNLTGFVPKILAQDIIKDVTRGSSVMRLSKVDIMKSDNKTFPVFAGGVGAYWVNETERIQTTTAQWIFPEIQAKKIAVIVPVTREKINDTSIDVFGEIKPYIVEAFHKAIDSACLFGTNSPFAKNLYGVASANSMAIQAGTNTRLDLDVSDVMALVEAKGFDINGFIADISFKNSLRKLRDANGNQLYVQGTTDKFGTTYDTLYSLPVEFSRSNAWDKTKALCIGGNWDYSIVGVREEVNYEVLREATLQNVTMSDNKPLSLAENDMIALKCTMRVGFLPVREDSFAILTPASSGSSTVSGGDSSVTIGGGGSSTV